MRGLERPAPPEGNSRFFSSQIQVEPNPGLIQQSLAKIQQRKSFSWQRFAAWPTDPDAPLVANPAQAANPKNLSVG